MGEQTIAALLYVCYLCILVCGYLANGAVFFLWRSVRERDADPIGYVTRMIVVVSAIVPFGMVLLLVVFLLLIAIASTLDMLDGLMRGILP